MCAVYVNLTEKRLKSHDESDGLYFQEHRFSLQKLMNKKVLILFKKKKVFLIWKQL